MDNLNNADSGGIVISNSPGSSKMPAPKANGAKLINETAGANSVKGANDKKSRSAIGHHRASSCNPLSISLNSDGVINERKLKKILVVNGGKSRQVAGEPSSNNVLQLQLRSARLGVCDRVLKESQAGLRLLVERCGEQTRLSSASSSCDSAVAPVRSDAPGNGAGA
jgi:hypothetical protein